MKQDQDRQRTGAGGDANKVQPQKGAPTAGNRDQNEHGKMPSDRSPMDSDVVGDDKTQQRAPQAGAGKPEPKR